MKFLSILFVSLWIASYIAPFLPLWLTGELYRSREGRPTSIYTALAIPFATALLVLEQRSFYLEPNADKDDSNLENDPS
jgi:hypothetical protein